MIGLLRAPLHFSFDRSHNGQNMQPLKGYSGGLQPLLVPHSVTSTGMRKSKQVRNAGDFRPHRVRLAAIYHHEESANAPFSSRVHHEARRPRAFRSLPRQQDAIDAVGGTVGSVGGQKRRIHPRPWWHGGQDERVTRTGIARCREPFCGYLSSKRKSIEAAARFPGHPHITVFQETA